MSKRIYLLRYTKHNKNEQDRLVRASTPSSALRHATRELFNIEVANTEHIVELLQKDVKVEDAKEGD